MAEILKEWLGQRLKSSIQWDGAEFGEKMKNGYTVACILHSYNIINDEKQNLIRLSNLHEYIKNNWKLLKEWLRDIGINLTDDELKNITRGEGSTILRLFYQLFLTLDKKDRTDFIKKERKMASPLVKKLGNCFSAHKVYDGQDPTADDLSKPLLNEKHFIDWQRKKSEEIKEIYDYVRYKYSKKLHNFKEAREHLASVKQKVEKISNADKNDIKKFSLKYPCKFENFSYEELIALDEKATNKNSYISDSEWSNEYMKNLFSRMHKKADSEEFQNKIMQTISGTLWNSSVAENESKLDLDLAKKVMKLSQFEKQMCTQIMETKQQARNLVNAKILAEKEFTDERTHQFNVFLDSVKEDINSGLSEIDFEKQRQQMLHKKLYDEKMKRKRQHHYEICYETLLSIIDFATKFGYYKRLIGDDIPMSLIHEWKLLYYKQQPIFDILTPIDDLILDNGEQNESEVEEVIDLKLEKSRQECLNEFEFTDYLNYLSSWSLNLLISNYDPESEERKYERLGNRVLGHVVYTLLELKYPNLPKKIPSDLPDFKTKALLVGLPNMSVAVAMQKLLEAQKIHVVRIESCIDFCLRCYKTEMLGSVDISLTFDKFINNAKEENTKQLMKRMKIDDEFHGKNNESSTIRLNSNTKQTQTPKTIPEEQIILSNPANLGKYAYDTLSSGDSLTDHLVADMILEYIKDQEDISGFVIINYPNNYREAQILEETFSGQFPPNDSDLDDNDDVFLEERIKNECNKEADPLKEYRISKLINNPYKQSSGQSFTSYFTCYMKLKKTEDIRQEFPIWDLTKENSELIDRFYSVLGINYSMYYEVIEKEQLALICKYVIGDYEMPLKTDDILFGANVLRDLDFPASEHKKNRLKIIKPETSNIKRKKKHQRTNKTSEIFNTPDLDAVNALDSTADLNDNNSIQNTIRKHSSRTLNSSSRLFMGNIKDVKLLAGEEDWEYSKMPISEKIGISLATCWEEIEKVYVHDVQQLLLSKRLQMNCLIPYTTFIKDKMNQIIMLPSHKQDLVCNFQKEYNDFEDNWRDIDETKNEWHCRVKELQNKLYDICDERKKHAEQQKHSLISENWIADELVNLANTYISFMQTEMNRFILTYQLLHDFYLTMIKGLPSNDRLISKELHKVLKETDEMSGSKKGGEDKLYKELKNAYLDLQLRNINIDSDNNPLNALIESNVKLVLKTVKDINDSYKSIISREHIEISKTQPTAEKKDDHDSGNLNNSLEMMKTNSLKCIEEWTMSVDGEMFRTNLRILALQKKCYEDMKLFCNHIFKTFTYIQDNINNYYMNEVKSVDRLCKYLQMAIEKGEKIPENLSLQDDVFVIDPNVLHFSTGDNITSEKTKETLSNMDFKIGQLARLRNTFKILGPTGIMLQQAFIYALQDFIFFGKESCDGPIFPAFWKQIDPDQIPKLVLSMFGETAYIDWRDFLIYCLNIPFPTIDELLEIRKRFRCQDLGSKELIIRDEYMNIELWFEKNIEPDKLLQLRNTLIKHFLFELFETSENVMNYSAFLLAVCKSEDPKEGFTKALIMAVGKKICYLLKECEEVIQKFIDAKNLRDECHTRAHKYVSIFLDEILSNVIATCEGITIWEVENINLPDKEKKGKKSKKGAKAKKIDSANSVRLAKSQTSLSKTTQLEIDELDKTQKEVLGKEEIMKKQKEEPLDDNIAYSVQQSTIWNVLQICLPWHFMLVPEDGSPYKTQIKELLMRLEQDTDDKSIYIAKFLSDPNICNFLYKTKRFIRLNFYEELLNISAE